jgi:hypothetical protein
MMICLNVPKGREASLRVPIKKFKQGEMMVITVVIARNEAIANTTRVQGFIGDCFVPRSDENNYEL